MSIKGSFSIVGNPRSGTTLLERLLNAHSQIGVCPENLLFGHIYRYNASPSTKVGFINRSVLLDARKWLHGYNDVMINLIDEILEQDEGITIELKELIVQIAEKYGQLKNAQIIGEKTPDHLYYIDTILNFCPSHRIILVKRDALDCSYSIAKAMSIQFGGRISDSLLLRAASLVKKGNKVLELEMRRTGVESVTLNYEDLVTDPSTSLKKLCDFLRVDFEDTSNTRIGEGYIDRDMKDLHESHRRLNEPISAKSVGSAIRELAKPQLKILEKYLDVSINSGNDANLSIIQVLLVFKQRTTDYLISRKIKDNWILVKKRVKTTLNRL